MTQEKSFEEQFPSLNGKVIGIWPTSLENPDDGRRMVELKSNSEVLCLRVKEEKRAYRNDFLLIEDVLQNCLDKQKVRDAIDRKLNAKGIYAEISKYKVLEDLKKELGL